MSRERAGAAAILVLLIAWGAFVASEADALPFASLLRLAEGAGAQAGGGAIVLLPLVRDLVIVLLFLAAVIAAAWGLGGVAASAGRLSLGRGGEAFVLDVALGLACVMTGLLAASCAGVLGIRSSLGILAAGLGAALWRMRRSRPGGSVPEAPGDRRAAIAIGLIASGLAVLALATAVLCMAPELNYDALFYHLGEARLDLLHGRVPAQPFNVYSRFPQGVELLFAWTLSMSGDDSLPRLLHATMGALTAAAAWLIARRFSSPLGGWMAAALFASTPVAILNASTALVDFGTSLFAVTALLAVQPWLEQPTPSRGRIALAGLLAGFAMACKYSAVVPAGVLGLIVVAAAARAGLGPHRIAGLAATFALFALAGVGPWLLRNAFIDGNPVAPFLGGLFGGDSSPESFGPLLGDMRNRVHGDGPGWLALPWTLAVRSRDWHHWLGPAWLALAPLLVWPRLPRPARWPLAFAVVALVVMTSQSHIVRLAYPALAVAAAIIGARLATLCRDRLTLVLAAAALALPCAGAALAALDAALSQRECVALLLGRETADSYLGRSHPALYPSPSHAVIRFANASLAEDAVVLLVGETRGAHLERRFVTVSAFDAHPLFTWATAAATGEDLARALSRHGITHLIVNERELLRIRQDELERLPQHARGVLDDFWARDVVVLRRDVHAGLVAVTRRSAGDAGADP